MSKISGMKKNKKIFFFKYLFLKSLNINYIESNLEILKYAKTILLCVKPKDIPGLLNQVSSCVSKEHLIISLAAGIQIKNIEKVKF